MDPLGASGSRLPPNPQEPSNEDARSQTSEGQSDCDECQRNGGPKKVMWYPGSNDPEHQHLYYWAHSHPVNVPGWEACHHALMESGSSSPFPPLPPSSQDSSQGQEPISSESSEGAVGGVGNLQRKSHHMNPSDDGKELTVRAFPCLHDGLNSGEIIDTGKRDGVGRPVFALGVEPKVTFIQQGLPQDFRLEIDFDAPVGAEDDSREDDFFWSSTGAWANGDVKAKDGTNLGNVNQKGVCVVMDGKNTEGHFRDWSMAWWHHHQGRQAHYPHPSHQHHHTEGRRGPVDPALLIKKITQSLLGEQPDIRGLLCGFYQSKEAALLSHQHFESLKASHASKADRSNAEKDAHKDKEAFNASSQCLKAFIQENL